MKINTILRRRQHLCKSIMTMLTYIFVGILAVRYTCYAHLQACFPSNAYCPHRSLAACAVAVIAEDYFFRQTLQKLSLLLGKGRSHRCYNIIKACRMQADSIHITFDNYSPTAFADSLQGYIQTKKQPSLIKPLRFRCIQIFRRAVVQHSAAKADYTSARIADRNNHTVAELVIIAVAPTGRQSGSLQHLRLTAALSKRADKRGKIIQRIAYAKAGNNFFADSAPCKISQGRFTVSSFCKTSLKKF